MAQHECKYLLEYLLSLRTVNRQWENEFLRSQYIEMSNYEIAIGTSSLEQNWHLPNNLKDTEEFKYDDVPFSIKISDIIGRHFISSRNIEAGEVLLVEPPAVLAPLVISPLKNSKSYCVKCLKEAVAFTCHRCGMFLCGNECNTESHEDVCYTLHPLRLTEGQRHIHRLRDCEFQKKLERLPEEDRLSAMKMVEVATSSFVKSHREKILKYYPMLATLKTLKIMKESPLLSNLIMSLQGNVNPSSNQFIVNTQRIVSPIMIELQQAYSSNFLHRIASIWDTNGFEVKIDKDCKGQGLYPASSFLTHSCLPNCEHSFTTAGVMVLRAVDVIPKDTILTICYTDQLWPTQVRIDHLLKTKKFQCKCKRCSDSSEFETFTGSVLCLECHGYLIEEAKWLKCRTCLKPFNKREILEIEARLSRDLSQFKANSFQDGQEKINSIAHDLHNKHHLILRLKFELSRKLKILDIQELNDDEIEAALSITSSLLEVMAKLYPKYSCQKAQVTKEVFRILMEKSKRRGSNPYEFLTPKEVSEAKLVLGWFGQSIVEAA